jgi:hypothetical protein
MSTQANSSYTAFIGSRCIASGDLHTVAAAMRAARQVRHDPAPLLFQLVHEARKAGAEREQQRHTQERAYRVMSALAGNFPGFKEASRALFAGKLDRLAAEAQAWPPDVLEYVLRLAGPANGVGTGKS